MKKTNYMTAVLLVVAILLMAACTPIPGNDTTTPSSSGGALQDNTMFGDGTSSASSQPASSATAPSSNVIVPSSGSTVPSSSASAPATQPSASATQPSSAPKDPVQMDFKTFQSLTGAEQRAFQESFESIEAFFAWYTAAKEAYDKANPPIEIGGNGVVTLPTTP